MSPTRDFQCSADNRSCRVFLKSRCRCNSCSTNFRYVWLDHNTKNKGCEFITILIANRRLKQSSNFSDFFAPFVFDCATKERRWFHFSFCVVEYIVLCRICCFFFRQKRDLSCCFSDVFCSYSLLRSITYSYEHLLWLHSHLVNWWCLVFVIKLV